MEAIRVERREGLVTITLDRPEKKNAIDADMWSELDRAFTEVAATPEDRALILTGAGGNFSAGADLSGARRGKASPGARCSRSSRRCALMGDIVLRLHRIPKPTLAVVDGVCVGVESRPRARVRPGAGQRSRALLGDLRQARARARRRQLVAAAAPGRAPQGEGARRSSPT